MTKAFLFLVATFLMGALTFASECSSMLGTCEYYQCLEHTEQCGSKGYYIKFGQHYCEKYQNKQSKYSDQGQEFITQIRLCLEEELEREQVKNNRLPHCEKVQKFAVGTHKYCYRKYDFCSLPQEDRTRIKLTAKKEVIHPQMLLFAFWLEKLCI